jgi:glutamate-1-semialdehyde 2,1-aminomutase
MLNRGLLITPFHNMVLMSPATTAKVVELHNRLFTATVCQLFATH